MLAVGEVCTMDLPREKITGGILFEVDSNKRFRYVYRTRNSSLIAAKSLSCRDLFVPLQR